MEEQSRQKILIVDDATENIKILIELLKHEYETFFAKDGKAAIEIAKKRKPDLILLDIIMPEMDGYEVCIRLKAESETKDIPVIFISAMSEEDDETRGLESGAVDYIVKPFKSSIVLARVNTHLELKAQRDALEKMANNLEQLNMTKNKFLGMAAHDMRNPLVSIRGFSQILKDQEDNLGSEENQALLNIIHTLSDDMLSLLNDLLDIAVIESGKFETNLAACDLKETLEKRIKLLHPLAIKKDIHVITDLKDMPKVECDINRIAQVFDNLYTNAIKYSFPNSEINIRCFSCDGLARVDIQDSGAGISKEDQKKLFGEFQKLSPRPTSGESSTGLGLSIVKKIIEAHGGQVLVDSEPGKGTTMSFLIP